MYSPHPLVRLTSLGEMNTSDLTQCFVVVLQGRESRVCTGITCCDFRDATMLFFRPGECQEYVDRMKKTACCAEVKVLCFCGEWLEYCLEKAFEKEGSLSGYQICLSHIHVPSSGDGYQKIYSWQKRYTFFQYHMKESLHLSLREKAIVCRCLDDIQAELDWDLDDFSNVLLAEKIKILFDYCSRYYVRQHLSRSCVNHTLMQKIERAVDDYLLSGDNCLTCCHVSSHRFAESLGMSDAYFVDFLRKETGKCIDKYVCTRHFEVAKHLLLSSHDSLICIARKLGYHSLQSFSATFKRVVGCSPSDYRNMN